MKAFIIALSLLAVLITGTALNCLYVENITDRLLTLEEDFPLKNEDGKSSPAAVITRARELWEESFPYLEFGANMRYLNAITTAFDNLAVYYENGTVADYEAARRQLVEALKTLKHSDSLSFGNII